MAEASERARLLARHRQITVEDENSLAALHRHLAYVRGAERDVKVATYQQNQDLTDRKRDQAATAATLPNTKEVWKVEGEIRALEEERDDIRLQLAHLPADA